MQGLTQILKLNDVAWQPDLRLSSLW
ncbi:hypothetical protein SBA1_530035 [Candidatus Sulfotelmatobacter kueseliae]|uniref:Uncharacterized protein n=1 Tax=Candidatus Sulfotelmatobacter kueseliae TaxID=2042962 RepID=A0A2U3KXQ6_9BACT|nr:hypothetical protein SBA1_530035 [Candidatus Sulfotelmatobacter kueseliae]